MTMGQHTKENTDSKMSRNYGPLNTYVVLLIIFLLVLILGIIFGINLFTESEPVIMAPGPCEAPFGEKVIS